MPVILPSSLSLTDSDNTTFPTTSGGTTNIAEDCAPSGINNALRSVAAMLAAMWGGMYSGTARPGSVQSGSLWLDTSGGVTAYKIRYYDGTDDIDVVTINTTSNSAVYVGDITGNVTGNVTGNLTGNVTGNLTGDVATLTTRGDLLYQGASADARLAIGTSGQVLTTDGTDPSWGRASSITLGTEAASTSGTTVAFSGIPSWARRVTMNLVGVSTDGTSNLMVQLGTSGGYTTSGYSGSAYAGAGSNASFTTGFGMTASLAAASVAHGKITIDLEDETNNTWVSSSIVGFSNTPSAQVGAGSVSLSGELTQIRLTSVSGDTFDAGAVNISYEG